MGLLSVLGKVGKGIVKGLPVIGPLIGGIGGALGGGAKASQQGRYDQAGILAQLAALNNRSRLDAEQFNLAAPGVRAGQVARGDVLSTMQNAPLTGDPRIDKFAGGGLRPSAFGAASRQAGGALTRQALQALLENKPFTPELATLQPAGGLERLGGAAGLAGGLMGVLNETGILGRVGQRQRRYPMDEIPDPNIDDS